MNPEDDRPEDLYGDPQPAAGDAIGDTVYSQRFVLKLLLKFQSEDCASAEAEPGFEDDLCTLWDMAAERDVVHFLQQCQLLDIMKFVLPTIQRPRLMEICIGIIANMCCFQEVVEDLMKMEPLLLIILENMQTEDSQVINEALRLINSCLYRVDVDSLSLWMMLFDNVQYSNTLYFILENNQNKSVLVNALENLNTICSYCNKDTLKDKFFTLFVNPQAINALKSAFDVITIYNKHLCDKEEMERVLVITLQIIQNLVGFDKSVEIFCDSRNKEVIGAMVNTVLKYYDNKLVNNMEMDTDLVDVIDFIDNIIKHVPLSTYSCPDIIFRCSYSMWAALRLVTNNETNGGSSFEDEDREELQVFTKQIIPLLCTLICRYMVKCSQENVEIAIDELGNSCQDIINNTIDGELKDAVTQRVAQNIND